MIISEAWRIFKRNIHIKFNGIEKFTGTDTEICNNIIKSCYNPEKKYFQVSPGKKSNYAEFYSRDFGWCSESLINLGYEKEVINTLDYAFSIYQKNHGITVAIDPNGKPFNFPNIYSPDSVAYMFRSLRIAKNKDLIIRYAKFLNDEAKRFKKICIDESGMIMKKHFSGMRDYAIIEGSCYDMIMACMLDDEINNLNNFMKREVIKNPFNGFDLKKNLIKRFWNGKYFEDYHNVVYGHTNIYPYFLDIIKDKKMIQSSLKAIHEAGLNNPIPLKYESKNDHSKFIWNEIFVSGWEKHTSWTMLGMAYIDVLSRIDKNKAGEHFKQYKALIEKNGFIEVYDGVTPYSSPFYTTETRMIWAVMYIDLKKNL
jgi:hypothetical protein